MTPASPERPLTARELEVARLAAQALTSRQIASRLYISERTVESHLQSAYAKTGTRNRVQLANWLLQAPPPPGSP